MNSRNDGQAITLVVASSPYGGSLHEKLVEYLEAKGGLIKVVDLGIHPSYVQAAYEVGRAIHAAQIDGGNKKGVICCGTGQGSVIIANKFKHVRASWIVSPADASIAASEDDSNIICFSSRFISSTDAEEALETWLSTEYGQDLAEMLQQQLMEAKKAMDGLDFSDAAAGAPLKEGILPSKEKERLRA